MTEMGYRGPQACKIVGITYRQLDYWTRTGLVVPSISRLRAPGRSASTRSTTCSSSRSSKSSPTPARASRRFARRSTTCARTSKATGRR